MPKLIQTTAGFIIAFEIELAMICDDDPLCGLYLSQHNYWSGTEGDHEGWICKTAEEWHQRTRLTRDRQDRIRAYLRVRNFIEEVRRGNPSRRYSRLVVEVIQQCVNGLPFYPQIHNVGNPQSSMRKTHNSQCGKSSMWETRNLS